MASKKEAEKQERDFRARVLQAYRSNKKNPVTLQFNGNNKQISGILSANKVMVRTQFKDENYADLELTRTGQPPILISFKDLTATNLAGGGSRGINATIPGLNQRLMKFAHKHLTTKNGKYERFPGDDIPHIFIKIPVKHQQKLIAGCAAIGGPIDYIYIGERDIRYNYNAEDNQLHFDGKLYTPAEFGNQYDLYFKIRRRSKDQRFDPHLIKDNAPAIFSKSATGGAARLDIVDISAIPAGAGKAIVLKGFQG